MLAMVDGCVPLVVAVALAQDNSCIHVYDHYVAAPPLAPSGVAASAFDCCEGVVGVTEKCEYIDHQMAASIDGPSLSHPLPRLADLPHLP